MIAAEIGLNLKSLRYYFERREDLVAAAFMNSIALHQRLATDALAEVDVERRVGRFVERYFTLQASIRAGEEPEFVNFGDLRSLTEPQSTIVWDAYNRMFRAIRQLFKMPGRSWSRARLNAAAHMLLSQLHWSVVWLGNYGVEDLERVTTRFSDILLHGITTASVDLRPLIALTPDAAGAADGLSQEVFLRTAIALVNHLGYRGASVDRISAELNVTKGAFYHYNATRDDLVVACFDYSFERIRDAQKEASSNRQDGASRVAAAAVSLVVQQMRDRGALLRTSALTAIGPDLRIDIAEKMSRLTARFGDMLNDGIIDGTVRALDVRIGAEMVTAMINSAEELGRWVAEANADNAASLYVRPLLDGLLADGDIGHPARPRPDLPHA